MADRVDQVVPLQDAIAEADAAAIGAAIEQLAEQEELVESLEALSTTQRLQLLDVLGDAGLGELLEDIDPANAAAVLDVLPVADAADVLEQMSPDDAADVFAELEAASASEILTAMEPAEADELRELLAYPPDTAGGRMTPAFVSISPNLRVDETVAALQQIAQEAETIYYVYVTESDDRLLGVISLRDLVFSPPETPISEITVPRVMTVLDTADQEEAARLLMEEELLAIPVVNTAGQILGIITADDVDEIVEEETTEDFERLGGSSPLDEPYLRASPWLLVRKRVFWLLILFVAGAYTATVLSAFQSDLDQVVELAFFIPLLIGIGGNVGSQVTTTLVRAMGVGEVSLRDIGRVVRKETQTAVILAVILTVAGFIRAMILGVGYDIAIVVAITAGVIVLWAAFVAAMLPLVLRQLKVDPAVVSAPLITTLVDGTGLLIYLTIARFILDAI